MMMYMIVLLLDSSVAGVGWVDLSNIAGAIGAVFCALQIRPMVAVGAMLFDVAVVSYILFMRILVGLLYGCNDEYSL